ncbi:hypothetical protein L6452_38504 [Arctium lappa]|uniref:Uncharacterized protein n=1 Tax=Arctium lappa TaxID=4217 RepID=A0ACB8XQ97_ARCLA|nr:hypothetical protein L6452_38504 [Arctium lappa]
MGSTHFAILVLALWDLPTTHPPPHLLYKYGPLPKPPNTPHFAKSVSTFQTLLLSDRTSLCRIFYHRPLISFTSYREDLLVHPNLSDNMAQFQNQELEYMIDDEYYDMNDFADSSVEHTDNHLNRSCAADSMDSDFEDDFEQSKPKTDTSAEEARNGKDIQGIPWERLNFTREKYRETRLRQYKNYENLLHSREDLEKECKQVDEGNTLYDFQYNTRLVKPTVVHFQIKISALMS